MPPQAPPRGESRHAAGIHWQCNNTYDGLSVKKVVLPTCEPGMEMPLNDASEVVGPLHVRFSRNEN